MRRMSEESHGDQEAADAAALLRGARMPDPPSAVKERIRRTLAEGPARRARFAAWRPLFVAIGLLLAGAAAASTWILLREQPKSDGNELSRLAPAVEPAPVNAAPAAPVTAAPSPREETAPGPAEGAARSDTVAPGAERSGTVAAAPAKAPRSRAAAKRIVARVEPTSPPAQPAAAEPAASSEEIIRLLQPSGRAPGATPKASPPEAELVLDATLALRRAHEPRRSLNLLKQYLTRYPHGALIEESMALAMEAMAALNDPSAARVAADYVQRYPAGRFVGLARTAMQRFAR